jgi:hypothetical protein
MSVKVIKTTDDWEEALRIAERLWREGRRCGRERVVVWNHMYPERPLRTANRFLVFEEKPR